MVYFTYESKKFWMSIQEFYQFNFADLFVGVPEFSWIKNPAFSTNIKYANRISMTSESWKNKFTKRPNMLIHKYHSIFHSSETA